jgi:hypothetical protein
MPLPQAIAQQIVAADQKLTALQGQINSGLLVRENLILCAALELGLNKTKLARLELAQEPDGRLVFRVPAAKQATAPAKP